MAATANIRAVITAEDKASPIVRSFGDNISRSSGKAADSGNMLSASWVKFTAVAAGVTIAAQKIVEVFDAVIESANRQQAALLGLGSVSKAFGQDQTAAAAAARKLASDGLMPLADAATGLKNLLAAGFNLDQAITLMNRFKDSAAFGRQGSLSFGEAIRGATEGIKNGNSILVDNAGVTKNLSMMLEEAGYSAQDLMKASSDAGVRQAIFNGILKETNAQLGDAEKLTGTFAGKQAQIGAAFEQLKVKLGEFAQGGLLMLLDKFTQLGQTFAVHVMPHVQNLWDTIQNKLGPSFDRLWERIGPILMPILEKFGMTLGVLIVANIIAVTQALDLLFQGIAKVIDITVAFMDFNVRAFQTVAANAVMAKNTIVGAFTGAWTAVRDMAHNTFNAIRSINWGAAIGGIGRSIGNALIGLVEGAVNSALGGLPGKPRISLPRFAKGVENFGGGLAIVGEQGPEVVALPRGSSVIPNNQIGGAGGTVINITNQIGAFTGSPQEMRKLSQEILEALKDTANMKNMTVQELLA